MLLMIQKNHSLIIKLFFRPRKLAIKIWSVAAVPLSKKKKRKLLSKLQGASLTFKIFRFICSYLS